MKLIFPALGLAFALTLAACTTEETPKKPESMVIQKNQLPQPFRFHKAIEVKPGLTFDILSWGRGSEYTGAYMILRSDSSKAAYKSINNELEGEIKDVWNMDIDSDGNPEIFIQAVGQEQENLLKMYVYEFTGSSQQELRFPDLTSSTRKQYRGKDSIYVKDGELFREIPLFEEADTAGVNPVGKKLLQYTMRGNSFNVKEIKDEKQENEKQGDKKK